MIAIFRSASLAGFLHLIKSKSFPLILFPTLGSNTHNFEGPVSFPSKSFEFSRAALASLACRLASSLGARFYRHRSQKLLPLLLSRLGKGAVPRNNRGPAERGAPRRAQAWSKRLCLPSQLASEPGLAPTLVPCFLRVVCSQLCWKTAKRDLWP